MSFYLVVSLHPCSERSNASRFRHVSDVLRFTYDAPERTPRNYSGHRLVLQAPQRDAMVPPEPVEPRSEAERSEKLRRTSVARTTSVADEAASFAVSPWVW